MRPRVLVNMAVTADGKIDTVERRGARISGPTDTARVDRLRAEADAILVGGHTLLREDPRLSVRDASLVRARQEAGRPPQPAKVAVVTRLSTPGSREGLPSMNRFLHDGGGRVIVFTTARSEPATIDRVREQGAEVIVHEGQRVDLPAAFARLSETGIERLMVEGGSSLVASLLDADLVDELQLAVAPLIFGGASAPTPVGGAGRGRDDAITLRLADAAPIGDGDVLLRYLVPGAAT